LNIYRVIFFWKPSDSHVSPCTFNRPYMLHHKASTVIKDPTHAVKVEVVPLSCNYQMILVIWCSYTICIQKIVAFGTARSMAYQIHLKKTHLHTWTFRSYLHENIPHLYYLHLFVSVQENSHSLLWVPNKSQTYSDD